MDLAEAKGLSFPLKSQPWEQDLNVVYPSNAVVVNSKVYTVASLFVLKKNHSCNEIYGKYSADKGLRQFFVKSFFKCSLSRLLRPTTLNFATVPKEKHGPLLLSP